MICAGRPGTASPVRRAREVGSIESLFGGLDMFTTTSSLPLAWMNCGSCRRESQNRSGKAAVGPAGSRACPCVPPLKLKAELEAEAERIGGKLGDPKVRRFKQYHTLITQGAEAAN